GRFGMDGREHRGGGRAVTQQLREEEVGNLAGVGGIVEPPLGWKRVAREPFEQLFAVGRDDVGLRVMDVRVDEAWDDQLPRVIDDFGIGGKRGEQRWRVTAALDLAVRQHEQAIGPMLVGTIECDDRIVDEVDDLRAKRPPPGALHRNTLPLIAPTFVGLPDAWPPTLAAGTAALSLQEEQFAAWAGPAPLMSSARS